MEARRDRDRAQVLAAAIPALNNTTFLNMLWHNNQYNNYLIIYMLQVEYHNAIRTLER